MARSWRDGDHKGGGYDAAWDDRVSWHQVGSGGSSTLGGGLGKDWCQVNWKKKFHQEWGVKRLLEVTQARASF